MIRILILSFVCFDIYLSSVIAQLEKEHANPEFQIYKQDMKVIKIMEILELLELMENLEMLEDIDILIEEEGHEKKG
ncbi:MAG: hypothetical protein SVZ03_11465 [Spirochaetota bacterium]|nr:hypothetical protein [Spirochaetota bacterium]